MSETWDAIVIGAGPAGMSAAALLTEHDVSVLLVDQNDSPGGQIYRGLSGNRADARLMTILGPDYARGSRLLARLERSGATLALSRTVWRIEPSGIVWAKSQHRIERLAARFIIIAAGAMERPVPISGWTLPGVMTVGALQIMLKSSGLVPEDKIVLAGTGPLLYLYGKQCVGAGVKHLTILDTASRRNRLLAISKLPAALQGQGPRYLLKGVRILRALRQQGVRMHTNVSRIAIEGTDSAVGVSFDSPRGLKRYSSPLIALHEGVLPDTYLARSIGCRHEWDEGDCAFRPTRNEWGETDRDRVYVVGDASGIMGVSITFRRRSAG